MVFIPAWVSNILFFATFYMSGYQHYQLKRPNPITNLQFVMMVFSLGMIVAVALYNRTSPWLSDAFLLAAIASASFMYRQLRMLPPLQRID
jgi:hypothetical protein